MWVHVPPPLITDTLRFAGQFDPAQSFRSHLIWINGIMPEIWSLMRGFVVMVASRIVSPHANVLHVQFFVAKLSPYPEIGSVAANRLAALSTLALSSSS
jgi:hypothetical protein